MKLRPTALHLPAQFHRPLRFGRRWRNHELPLRLIQVVVIVAIAAVAAPAIATGVTLAVKAIARFLT